MSDAMSPSPAKHTASNHTLCSLFPVASTQSQRSIFWDTLSCKAAMCACLQAALLSEGTFLLQDSASNSVRSCRLHSCAACQRLTLAKADSRT